MDYFVHWCLFAVAAMLASGCLETKSCPVSILPDKSAMLGASDHMFWGDWERDDTKNRLANFRDLVAEWQSTKSRNEFDRVLVHYVNRPHAKPILTIEGKSGWGVRDYFVYCLWEEQGRLFLAYSANEMNSLSSSPLVISIWPVSREDKLYSLSSRWRNLTFDKLQGDLSSITSDAEDLLFRFWDSQGASHVFFTYALLDIETEKYSLAEGFLGDENHPSGGRESEEPSQFFIRNKWLYNAYRELHGGRMRLLRGSPDSPEP